MSRREELHDILVETLGSTNVYFQPPPTVKMKYPCIVYGRNNVLMKNADNLLYKVNQSYMVTVIDANPDSLIPSRVAEIPQCKFDRNFTADNLNHEVYTIYY